MSSSAQVSTDPQAGAIEVSPPTLLVELPPWRKTFVGNLFDIFGPPDLLPFHLGCEPAPFWDDVFVSHPFPAANLFRSLVLHALAVSLVYALTISGAFDRRTPALQNPFHESSISYYPTSDYLPPLESPRPLAKIARKGEPKLARQEIISVPPEPDNTRQTIILPNAATLNHDVALPNIILATPATAIQPISASARTAPLKIPQLPVEVVAPAPEIDVASRRSSLALPADVVAPAPDPIPSNAHVPSLHASVVGPPPSIDEVQRRAGQINMSALAPAVAEPKLPVAVQRATGAGNASAQGSAQSQPQVAPVPSTQGLGSGRTSGQLIALSLNPTDVKGPVEMPAGNRRGVFAAGPQGKPDAPGTPEIKGGGIHEGSGSAAPGNGAGPGTGGNAGISVGKAPAGATISPIVGSNSPVLPQAPGPPRSAPSLRDKLMAATRPPDIGRQPPPGAPPKTDRAVEDSVFGTKRSYRLSLNMPNLNSATGSWVIRFAELTPSQDKSELSAPVATVKVDPAYPADLLRDRVEGTVVLYAIIRADGTISDIRVLSGVDDRLNANAIKALGRWKFRPGSKHGEAIDLEAVVQIPFRATKNPF